MSDDRRTVDLVGIRERDARIVDPVPEMPAADRRTLLALVDQLGEALRQAASEDDTGQPCWCDGHLVSREDLGGKCVREQCAKARVALALLGVETHAE